MSEIKEINLEWQYEPKNYLEEDIEQKVEGGILKLAQGVASASIDPKSFNDETCSALTQKVSSCLAAAQLARGDPFSLSEGQRTDLRCDGTTHHYVSVQSIYSSIKVDSVDIVVRNANGDVVSDTKRERLDKQAHYAKLIEMYRSNDSHLDQMLHSYSAAMNDPENEFAHLYEVRDCLVARFGCQTNVLKALSITKKHWDEIGKAANVDPLTQGRHRGSFVGELRPATAQELNHVRALVTSLIHAYLDYLAVLHEPGLPISEP